MGCDQFGLWSVLGCCLGVRFSYLVEVDVHALELEVRSAVVDTRAVEAMLAGNGLPEGGTNLVTLQRLLAVVLVVLSGGGRLTH